MPAAAAWPGVRRSRVYQVCLDIPSASYDAESAFWSALTGRPVDVLARRPEFALASRRRDARRSACCSSDSTSPTARVRAHLDVGTSDRGAEVERHVGLGARVLATDEFWTVLADPAGLAYCVTDRDPATGEITGEILASGGGGSVREEASGRGRGRPWSASPPASAPRGSTGHRSG